MNSAHSAVPLLESTGDRSSVAAGRRNQVICHQLAVERPEVDPGIDNLDKIAFGVGVLPHVLLLTPELAYREIYTAYEQSPAFEH